MEKSIEYKKRGVTEQPALYCPTNKKNTQSGGTRADETLEQKKIRKRINIIREESERGKWSQR